MSYGVGRYQLKSVNQSCCHLKYRDDSSDDLTLQAPRQLISSLLTDGNGLEASSKGSGMGRMGPQRSMERAFFSFP